MYKSLIPKSVLFLFLISFIACSTNSNKATAQVDSTKQKVDLNSEQFKKAYFASGCFWCVEAIYEHAIGVQEVHNGYSGGHSQNPTYEASNTGKTGHAEAVEIIYDPKIISFSHLVDIYFGTQNIEQVNGQGPDRGSQYRTIAFFQNEEEKAIIDKKVAALTNEGYKVGSEVTAFEKFWMGEDYHQDYERLHPNHPYIKAVSIPRLEGFKKKFPALVKK